MAGMVEFNMELCFEIYKNRYQELLRKYYPAHNSAGFTERNQSVNFVQSVNAIYPSSFAWFEASLNIKPEQHMDAVIFVPETKSTLLIEAKRFSTPHNKLKDIAKDIGRLNDSNHHQTVCIELKGEFQKCTQNIFGIILADVWLENTMKNNIYEFWGEDFLKKYETQCSITTEIISNMENIKWYKSEKGYFEDLKYCLLAIMFRIKQKI